MVTSWWDDISRKCFSFFVLNSHKDEQEQTLCSYESIYLFVQSMFIGCPSKDQLIRQKKANTELHTIAFLAT